MTTDLDFDQLLKLARDKSVAGRNRLTVVLSEIFQERTALLSERERSMMVDILNRLVLDVELSVRKELANRLATDASAPAELVAMLARDEIGVAFGILTESAVLQDRELIEIIRHRTLEHQLAITMRGRLSEDVSDALIETRSEEVVTRLLENPGARIAPPMLAHLVDESKGKTAYQAPLLKRDDLTADLARRMYWWVSAALRKHIIDKYKIDPSQLDARIETTIKSLLGEGQAGNLALDRDSTVARKLRSAGAITPQLLVQTLRRGEITLFVSMFAELCGLRDNLIRRFIFEPGGEGFVIACRGIGIDKPDFVSIFLLSRAARPGEKVVETSELARAVALFDRVKPDVAKRVVEHWRLDPHYLDAIRQVHGNPASSAKADFAAAS